MSLNKSEIEFIEKKFSKNLEDSKIKKIIFDLKNENFISNDIKTNEYISIFYIKNENFNKSIEFCKKILSLVPNNFEIFCLLGHAYYSTKNIEEAIANYNLAYQINSKLFDLKNKIIFLEKERMNLIDFLTFFKPEENSNNNNIVRASIKLFNIDSFCDLKSEIKEDFIVSKINQIKKIIDDEKIDYECNATQTYRRNEIFMNCKRHKNIFEKYNTIAEHCFNCYKIQIEPKNIVDFIKLFFIFDNLNIDTNPPRKLMIELRPKIEGHYKGIIFCQNKEQANFYYKIISDVLLKTVRNNVVCKIKRGCSEFGMVYSNYKIIDNKNDNFMTYNKKWKKNEIEYDQNNSVKINSLEKNTLKGITVKDALVIYNWILYAKYIQDITYTKLTNSIHPSKFMKKLLYENKNYNSVTLSDNY